MKNALHSTINQCNDKDTTILINNTNYKRNRGLIKFEIHLHYNRQLQNPTLDIFTIYQH